MPQGWCKPGNAIRYAERVLPERLGRLAQLVEQRFYTAKVTGSSPVSPTITKHLMARPSGVLVFVEAIHDEKASVAGTRQQAGRREQGRAEKSSDENFSSAWPSHIAHRHRRPGHVPVFCFGVSGWNRTNITGLEVRCSIH